MKAWRQIISCLVIVFVAAAGWFYWQASGVDQKGANGGPSGAQSGGSRNGAGSGPARAPLVVATPVEENIVNDRLEAIGTARAAHSVSVTPYSSGTLVALEVEAGARVNPGDVIARLDAEAEEIALAKAKALAHDAQAALERIMRLRETNTATRVQEVVAELAVANTKLAVQDAELALSRRTVRSPIAGIVGILPVDSGNYVTAQTMLARIDDTSKILMDLWVPERFVSQIDTGLAVDVQSIALPDRTYQGKISALDNMVDEASRTLRIRGEFDNPEGLLRSGMSFNATIKFPGETYPSINPLAVQWGAEGAYVWRIEDDTARRVPVRIIRRNATDILVNGELAPGDMVVTEGVQSVRDGAKVTLKGQSSKEKSGVAQ